jgi:hypothetical protein
MHLEIASIGGASSSGSTGYEPRGVWLVTVAGVFGETALTVLPPRLLSEFRESTANAVLSLRFFTELKFYCESSHRNRLYTLYR